MKENRILIGLGDENWDNSIKRIIEEKGVGTVVMTALLRQNIVKNLAEKEINVVIISEKLPGKSDKTDDHDWIQLVEEIKEVSIYIRIVFVCDRKEDDILLTKLAYLGVNDIFLENMFPAGWTEQLKNEPKIENVKRFRKQDDTITQELKLQVSQHQLSPEEILSQHLLPRQAPTQAAAPVDDEAVEQAEQTVKKDKKQKPLKEKSTKQRGPIVLTTREVVYEQVRIAPLNVAVLSLFDNAGSSTVLRMLAEYAAQLDLDVGICETGIGYPSWFMMLNDPLLQKRLEQGEWKSWHSTLLQSEIPHVNDIVEHNHVKYIIREPQKIIEKWNAVRTAELLAYSRQISLLFHDLSHHYLEEANSIALKSADYIIVVINYDPVRIEREIEHIRTLLSQYDDKLIVICNRSTARNERRHRKELLELFNRDSIYHIALLEDIANVYAEGESLLLNGFVDEHVLSPVRDELYKILEYMITQPIMSKLNKRKRKGFLDSVVNHLLYASDEELIDESPI